MTLDEAIKHAENVALNNENGLYDAIALGGQNPSQEEIDECMRCAEEHRQLAEWLKELKKHQWIPVSDGLPELKYEHNDLGLRFKYSDNVLVVINRGSYLECDESFEIMHLSDDMNGKELYWCGYDYDCDFGDVLAWMPLPPPYEGDDEHE